MKIPRKMKRGNMKVSPPISRFENFFFPPLISPFLSLSFPLQDKETNHNPFFWITFGTLWVFFFCF